jgi:hypothetical protein
VQQTRLLSGPGLTEVCGIMRHGMRKIPILISGAFFLQDPVDGITTIVISTRTPMYVRFRMRTIKKNMINTIFCQLSLHTGKIVNAYNKNRFVAEKCRLFLKIDM